MRQLAYMEDKKGPTEMALSIQEVRASCPEITDLEELKRQFAEIQKLCTHYLAHERERLLEERVGPCYTACLDTFPLN